MGENTPDGTTEFRIVMERLRAEHTKHASITEGIARTIEDLQRVIDYLERGVPIQMHLQTASALEITGLAPALTPNVKVTEQPSSRASDPGFWTRRLRGLSHMKALVRIAQETNGVIRTTEARDILMRSGIASGKPRNVNSHIHTLLSRSEQFEWVSAGVYRLIQPVGPPATAPRENTEQKHEELPPLLDIA